MKKYLKQLANDSLIYGLSGIISSFISVFLIPLYTRVFIPADYGVISILTTTAVFLNIVVIFGLDNSAAVFFWDKPEEIERKKTFNSWLYFVFLAGLVSAGSIMLLSVTLSKLFFNTETYANLFILVGLNLFFTGVQKIFNIWCRVLQQPFRAVIFSIVLLLVTVTFNIIFILHLKIGVVGVFYSQVIASFVGLIVFFIVFRYWFSLKYISRKRVKEMIRLSAPLVPAGVLYWMMNSAAVYFLKMKGASVDEIGLYQVGSSVANVLSLGTWAFFQAWSPFALSVSKQENAKDIYRVVFEIYCVVGFFIAFSLMLMSTDILVIFTRPNYFGASAVLGLLAINVILLGIPNIISIANNLAKQNSSYAFSIAIGAAITIPLFLLLIPGFGKEGAAVAMIFGNSAVIIFLVFRVQKLYYIPYNFPRIIIIIIFELVVFLTTKAWSSNSSILIHSICVALMASLLFLYYARSVIKIVRVK